MAYENFTGSNGETITNYGYIVQIWNRLSSEGIPDYGIAALMGNLYSESMCVPYICQGNTTYPFSASRDYTERVTNGTISEYAFVHYGANGTTAANKGYGLAQWTINARKQPLYTMFRSGYSSIGSTQLALDYLMVELNGTGQYGALNYRNVLNYIKDESKTMRQRTNYVLTNFENPKDQSDPVKQLRYRRAQTIYEYMTQTVPPTDPPDDGSGGGGGGGGGNGKPDPLNRPRKLPISCMIRKHFKDERTGQWLL